mmetsp:Transcript_9464/g.21652  ORF Transcript_9464/g.21652 Transcript_9464/m.21652 type:complete len:311 (+) Transcript_9464:30-962(+)
MSCSCDYGPILPPPLEGDGPNVVSFDVAAGADIDLEAIGKFFQDYGFVVLRNVAPPEVIDQCEQEVFDAAGLTDAQLQALETVEWRQVFGSAYNMGKGFVGSKPATGPGSIAVRQQPGILAVYAHLFGNSRLYPTTDRFGLMRPTSVHPEWATETGFVHWDQNPTSEPDFARIQGVLCLSPHTPTSGGFHCVPGSHLWFKRYGEAKQCPAGSLIAVDCACVVENHLFRIPCPRGSLIVWDSRTAHGNWPNQGTDEWRKVLYMSYFVPDAFEAEMYRKHFNSLLNYNPLSRQVLTEAGKKLFAQVEYEPQE